MRRRSRFQLIALLTGFLLSHSARPQTFSQADLFQLQEELILETNATIFIPGESVLLGLTLTNHGLPETLSKVAYIELLDKDRNVIIQKKTGIHEGKGAASLYLPSYLKTGNYTLITYTKWMKNYPPIHIPQRMLKIVNPYEKLPIGLFEVDSTFQLKVHFQTESSYWIPGVDQKVGFQVTDQFDRGMSVKGKAVNSKGEIIREFESNGLGSGTFQITPSEGETYQAILLDPTGKAHFSPIQVAWGIVLLDIKETDSSFILIKRIDRNPEKPKTLEVWSNNQRLISESYREDSYSLNKSSFPKNLLTLRLLNESGIELYQRSFFNAPERVRLEMSLSTDSYSQREKAVVSFGQWSLSEPHPLSLTVRQLVKSENRNSLPEIHLSQSVGTKINWPSEPLPNLNQVLVTKEHNFENAPYTQPIHLPDLHGELMQGTLTAQGNPIRNSPISLTTQSPDWDLLVSKTDPSGKFHMTLPETATEGTSTFYMESVEGVQLHLIDPFLQTHEFVQVDTTLSLSPDLEAWLLQKSIAVQIENAYYDQKRQPDQKELPDFRKPLSKPKTYYLDEFTRFPTIEDVIREYVSEVWLRKKGDVPVFSLPFVPNSSYPIDTALILLNGVPVTPSFILSFNQAEIEKIELFNEQIKIGKWEYKGIINFQTFDAKPSRLNPTEKYQTITMLRTTPYQVFQTPEYETDSPSRIPDFRTQLMWIPHVTPSQINEGVSFYTSDVSGRFEAILFGITKDGGVIYERIEFEVAKEPKDN